MIKITNIFATFIFHVVTFTTQSKCFIALMAYTLSSCYLDLRLSTFTTKVRQFLMSARFFIYIYIYYIYTYILYIYIYYIYIYVYIYIYIYIHVNLKTNVIVKLPHSQSGSGSSKSIFITHIYLDRKSYRNGFEIFAEQNVFLN